jgi:hypothetical protein
MYISIPWLVVAALVFATVALWGYWNWSSMRFWDDQCKRLEAVIIRNRLM